MDWKEAIAPECECKIVGIRPGEKLHEVLLPADESRSAIELEDMYIIEPNFEWWEKGRHHRDGRKCPEGFEFRSDHNPRWLSVKELSCLAGPVESEADGKRSGVPISKSKRGRFSKSVFVAK